MHWIKKSIYSSFISLSTSLLHANNILPSTKEPEKTVIQYVVERLKKVGITHIFGVPGDYAFPINEAICLDKKLTWVGCCNELNAAYAADGYARIKGISVLCTTFGVGELSALNGIAGSYAEHVPIIHLVGMPSTTAQKSQKLLHHMLGKENNNFSSYVSIATFVTCATTVLTADNCVEEVERVLHALSYHKRPIYIGIPADTAHALIKKTTIKPIRVTSDPIALHNAIDALVTCVRNAHTACVLPGIFLDRFNVQQEALAVIEASQLPFAHMFMDKCSLNESNPLFIGLYDGALVNKEVRMFVESCDCIILMGSICSDTNMGGFTANIPEENRIEIMPHYVRIRGKLYEHVEIRDVLIGLAKRIPKKTVKAPKQELPPIVPVHENDPLTADYLYAKYRKFIQENDIIIVETGTSSFGLAPYPMPNKVQFLNQALWCSIGWATAATLGCTLAAPDKRVILLTGEGSHQATVQDICQLCRHQVTPIIFVLNNNGYLLERVLSKYPMLYYNDIPCWTYTCLPQALGCKDWFIARVRTCGDLDAVLEKLKAINKTAYIEVITPTMSAPPLVTALQKTIQKINQQ